MFWSAWTIAKREIKSLFVSPVAYVVLGIFALISGIQFLQTLQAFDEQLERAQVQAQLMQNPEALNFINLNGMLIASVIGFGFILLLFAIPAIAMRLLSEEKNQGTYELLMTSPLSSWDIVLGKFIAGVIFLGALLATHGLFLLVVFTYGNPEPLPVFSGYLGLFLGGASFLAMGLFASSLSKNQIVAFFIALLLNLAVLMVGWSAKSVTGNLSTFLENIAITTHFESFNKGIIAVSSLVYFISLIVFFLSISKVAVEAGARK